MTTPGSPPDRSPSHHPDPPEWHVVVWPLVVAGRLSAVSPADKPPSTGSPNPRHTTRAPVAAGRTPVGWRETRETRAAEPCSVHQGHSPAGTACPAPPRALSRGGGNAQKAPRRGPPRLPLLQGPPPAPALA